MTVGPTEPAHWERGRYVTPWRGFVRQEQSGYVAHCLRRWVRTEAGWDEELRYPWEL